MARPATKKNGIEEAAIGLFATRGISSTTIKDIADRAGVTEGALYRHYSGKTQMAWRLYCREVGVFLDGFIPQLRDSGDTLEGRVLAAVKFIYRYYRDTPEKLAFVLLARRSFPDRGLDGEQEVTNPDDVVQQFVKEEIAIGRVPKSDTVLMMAMLRGVVLEPILMHRDGRLETHPLRLAEKVAAACTAILRSGKP